MRFLFFLAACTAAVALAADVPLARADEPGWTNQERLAERDVACTATVVSIEKVGTIDERSDVHLAEVDVSGMLKGKKASVGSRFNVYFEAMGARPNKRHPARVKLAVGEKATFYLRTLTDAIQESLHLETVKQPALFLEMASDVQKIEEVLQVDADAGSVVTSAGRGDGAAVGDVFSVYRDERPAGRLTIIEVRQDESTASVTTLQGVEKLEIGDRVVSDGALQFLSQLRPDSNTESPAELGRQFAAADIGRGRPRILYYGLPWSQGKPFVDEETGYAVTITNGCIVGKDFRLFADEYNLAIREHFKQSP